MAMPRLSWENFTALAPRISSEQRRAASVAGVAHALHDGYTDLIYIMLPLWQAEFGLTYAALGALRSMFVGSVASAPAPSIRSPLRLSLAPLPDRNHSRRSVHIISPATWER